MCVETRTTCLRTPWGQIRCVSIRHPKLCPRLRILTARRSDTLPFYIKGLCPVDLSRRRGHWEAPLADPEEFFDSNISSIFKMPEVAAEPVSFPSRGGLIKSGTRSSGTGQLAGK